MGKAIKRYLSPDNLERMNSDFGPLLKLIQSSRGELDLYLRDDYFNIYYKGNSLAKVVFVKKTNDDDDKYYDVEIHTKFIRRDLGSQITREEKKFEERFSGYKRNRHKKEYSTYRLPTNMLHPFFQRKNLNAFCANIKAVNYSEELSVEQQFINDNRDHARLLFIDRQVVFPGGKNPRIDLLALQRDEKEENRYSFLVIELKMGNNAELAEKVGPQLDQCIANVKENFIDYKDCYEKNYKQSRMLGLIPHPPNEDDQSQSIELPPEIEIVERNETKVDGLVVAVGYTGIAQKAIQILKANHPQINERLLSLRIGDL